MRYGGQEERKSEREPAGIGNAKCTNVYPSSFSGDSKSFTARCRSGIHLAPHTRRSLATLPYECVLEYVPVSILKVTCIAVIPTGHDFGNPVCGC